MLFAGHWHMYTGTRISKKTATDDTNWCEVAFIWIEKISIVIKIVFTVIIQMFSKLYYFWPKIYFNGDEGNVKHESDWFN